MKRLVFSHNMNHLLTFTELENLLVGTTLSSPERGQSMVVMTTGGGATAPPMRIKYVREANGDDMAVVGSTMDEKK
ncbi:hypothetical protein SLA2020_124400 [Shorea laevis]